MIAVGVRIPRLLVRFSGISCELYQKVQAKKDLPLGDHKKRAKYRFASKTLMRVLPNDLKEEVEGLIDKEAMTMDLYEILGHCTWGKNKAAEVANAQTSNENLDKDRKEVSQITVAVIYKLVNIICPMN